MPLLPAPAQLSHAEKDALIAALTARLALADQRIAAQDERIAVQDARIAALEARLNQPPKTPGNSSKPPSQGQKPDLAAPGADRPSSNDVTIDHRGLIYLVDRVHGVDVIEASALS